MMDKKPALMMKLFEDYEQFRFSIDAYEGALKEDIGKHPYLKKKDPEEALEILGLIFHNAYMEFTRVTRRIELSEILTNSLKIALTLFKAPVQLSSRAKLPDVFARKKFLMSDAERISEECYLSKCTFKKEVEKDELEVQWNQIGIFSALLQVNIMDGLDYQPTPYEWGLQVASFGWLFMKAFLNQYSEIYKDFAQPRLKLIDLLKNRLGTLALSNDESDEARKKAGPQPP